MSKIHLQLPYSAWSGYQYAWCMTRFKGRPTWEQLPKNATNHLPKVTCQRCLALYKAASKDDLHPLSGFVRLHKTTWKLDNSEVLSKAFKKIAFENKQILHCLVLDKHFQLIYEETVAIGSPYDVAWSVREVFRPAILRKGYSIALGRSEPSEMMVAPSDDDTHMAKTLIGASLLMQIELLDILLVSTFGHTSMRLNTDLWEIGQQQYVAHGRNFHG